MFLLEKSVEMLWVELKHLAGHHDQSTHGNRFRMIAGARRQVRIGGRAGVIQYNEQGDPLTHGPVPPPAKKPGKAPLVKIPDWQKNNIAQGKIMSADDIVSLLGDAYAKDPDKFTTKGEGGDLILGAIFKHQGFDGKPDVVSPDEMDVYVTTGKEKEGYRGFEDGKGFDEMYMKGDYYPGYGVYGNGTYVANVKAKKVQEAKVEAGIYASANYNDGAVLRLSTKKGANIGSYSDLTGQKWAKFRETEQTIKDINHQLTAIDPSDASYASLLRKKSDQELLQKVYRNTGAYAASRGYDGYKVDVSHLRSSQSSYQVILNRTATRVSTKVHHKSKSGKWID